MALLERDSFQELLNESLACLSKGAGRVALVAGEAGIGKTTMIHQFAAGAERKGARLLWGGCEALFTPHPLAPLHDIARQIGGDFPAVIAGAAYRHEVFNAALDRFTQLPSPTIVVFEDVHWADEATLDLIKFLGRRLQRLALMLIATYRDDELGERHPLRAVIGDLPRDSVCRISLPPLSKAAVDCLAEAAGRPAEGLHAATSGNPFFVTEVLAAPSGSVPATVCDAVIARMTRLSPPAMRLARFAAVFPGGAERWLLEHALGADSAAIQECLAAGMEALSDASLGYRHDLARRAVEDSIPPGERQDLHALALAALLDHGADKVAIGRLVHHADGAGDAEAVLRFAPEAAERAAAVGAHREAALHLQTALRHAGELAEAQRAPLLERLSYELYLTGRPAEAAEARKESLALWRSLGSRAKEGDGLRWLSRLSWFNGQKASAEIYATEAVAVLEGLPPGRELAMAYSNLAQLHMLGEETEPALAWGRKALELATTLGESEIRIHALTNIGSARLAVQDPAGRKDLQAALEAALAAGFEEHAARAYTNLSTVSARQRDFATASAYLKAGIEYCEEHDLDSWARYLIAHRADLWQAQGRWEEATKETETLVRQPRVTPITRIPALTVLGRLRIRRGEPDGAALLAEAHVLARPTNELQRQGPVLAALAETAWLDGREDADLLATLAAAHDLSLKRADPWIRGELAFWLWRHGRLKAPVPAVPEPFALQIAGNWQGAAQAWERIGCPYEQAMALADADKEADLRAGLGIAERLGAAPLGAILRRKLRAKGVRGIPRGAQARNRGNPRGITARELKVLALLAEGRRNADIAQRLFVSEKTVGHHVSAVLAKLGVHSRGEAVATARGLGLFGPQNMEPAAKK
jgi:DNA-binding CsgD family transcriptional regulator